MINRTVFALLKQIKSQSTVQTHFNIHNAGSSQFTQPIYGPKTMPKLAISNKGFMASNTTATNILMCFLFVHEMF